jgi:hypothetical protein
MTDVLHSIILKWKRSFTGFWWIYVIFAEIVENQACFTLGVRANVQTLNPKPQLVKNCLLSQQLSYCYKYTTKGVFCILIPQLLKFWKIKFETTKPCLF